MSLRHFENKFYRAPVVLPIEYGTNKRSVTKQLNQELGQQRTEVWNVESKTQKRELRRFFT